MSSQLHVSDASSKELRLSIDEAINSFKATSANSEEIIKRFEKENSELLNKNKQLVNINRKLDQEISELKLKYKNYDDLISGYESKNKALQSIY